MTGKMFSDENERGVPIVNDAGNGRQERKSAGLEKGAPSQSF